MSERIIRRRNRSPSRPEARPLTSTENDTPTPVLPAVELEHAESGAPDPEQLEQTVESLGGAPVAPDSPLFSDFDVHPDIVAALAEATRLESLARQIDETQKEQQGMEDQAK